MNVKLSEKIFPLLTDMVQIHCVWNFTCSLWLFGFLLWLFFVCLFFVGFFLVCLFCFYAPEI